MTNIIQLRAVDQITPNTENGKVSPPVRQRNADRRSREYLTRQEVEALQKAAKQGRHGHRDATLILVAYRHALRVSEIVGLSWQQIDLSTGLIHVNRAKRGTPSVHPLGGAEMRALRRLQRESGGIGYVFMSERKTPMTTSNVRKMMAKAGKVAGLDFPVHPHMLRHAAGYKLANEGHDTRAIQHYMGHKNIQHTVRYTELANGRFQGFWQD